MLHSVDLSGRVRLLVGIYAATYTVLCAWLSFAGDPNVNVFGLLVLLTLPCSAAVVPIVYGASVIFFGPGDSGVGAGILTFTVWMTAATTQLVVALRLLHDRQIDKPVVAH